MSERVIIIGAGIIGAAIARCLAEAGASVTVLETTRPAAGATSKSFAWINANYPATPAYFRLRQAAISEWRALPEALKNAAGLRWGGSLAWEADSHALEAQAKALADFGHDAELIDRTQFAALAPAIAAPPDQSLYCKTEGAVDPVRATEALLSAAVAAGAELVLGCPISGFTATGVETPFGEMQADRVVIAAGAATSALLEKADVRLPMENKAGLILHTKPVQPVSTHLLLSPDIHFRQEADGRLVAGEIFSGDGAHADWVESRPLDLAHLMLDLLRKRLPGIGPIELGALHLGHRPMPADGFPAIGTLPGMPRLYVASTHSGITLAPLIGRLAAREIMGAQSNEAAGDMIAPFRPDRF